MKIKFRIQNLAFTMLFAAMPLLAASFTDNSNGTVSDTGTGLVWQKCSMGQNNDATCTGVATTATWANALTYCNTLTLGNKSAGTWRLPNINELSSIVDTTITPAPAAINNTIFPATVANGYWSSSSYVPLTSSAWGVYFNAGGVGGNGLKSNSLYVRCVSTGP
jgi:hypothetical protein